MCTVVEPQLVGWCKTEKSGICVDPFHQGAHMANGGVTNVKRVDEPAPPIMCTDCWDRVRAMGPDEERAHREAEPA
jgi:hypothetical protein